MCFINRALDGNCKDKRRFDLGHALQKLTSQHRNVQCLTAFAHSPRLEPLFHCRLSVICVVPQLKRTVVLPKTVTEWEGIIHRIVPPHESVGGSWVEREANSLIGELGKRTKWDAPVHCECALIEHYSEAARSAKSGRRASRCNNSRKAQQKNQDEENRKLGKEPEAWKVVGRKETSALSGKISEEWKFVPVFSYLGVSKLSCSPCQAWIEAYNRRDELKFYTRGSHGKWYWPWAIPRYEETQLSRSMQNQISTTYYEHCRAKERVRRGSDGSNARMRSGQTLMDRRHGSLAADIVSRMRKK